MAATRLPAYCGDDIGKEFIANPYILQFRDAARLRLCKVCRKQSPVVYEEGIARCGACGCAQIRRAYRHLSLICGRQFGKTFGTSHLVREELQRAGGLGWVCGPTFKYLNDSTMPTFIRLIPPAWVAHWSDEHMELRLINGHLIKFRSLDDPERGRGPTSDWAWLDEAALMSERAWDVLSPQLARKDGAVYVTTTPAGYDWIYNRFWVPAMINRMPGFWAAQAKSIEGSGMPAEEITYRRKIMPDALFRQEYEADFVTLTGAVYGDLISQQTLRTEEQVRQLIPEWPQLDRSREVHIGLDSGVDHPFGATLTIATPKGMVVVKDYLERNLAPTTNIRNIQDRLAVGFSNPHYAANKNEASLRLEFAQYGILVAPVDANQQAGIMRVHHWLAAKQLWFVAASAGGDGQNAERTIRQMVSYRYAENLKADGTKRANELVIKKDDELPDGVRYTVMSFPSLPKLPEASNERDLSLLPPKVRADIEFMREYEKRLATKDLSIGEKGWPFSDMYGDVDAVDTY